MYMLVRDLPLDVGNEVIVLCKEDLGDDEMAEVCLDFPHVEEVEIEVVDLMDVHEYSTGAPDLWGLKVDTCLVIAMLFECRLVALIC